MAEAHSNTVYAACSKPTHPRFIDREGRRYGRLVVTRFAGRSKKQSGLTYWECQCDCGTQKVVQSSKLVTGRTTSCGCLQVETSRARQYKHGKTGTRVYRSWVSMLDRCDNPRCRAYKDYGGRGITVCARWHDFQAFYADVGDPPPLHSLDRVDNNKGYCPDNCRWATQQSQCRNRRNNRMITYNGETKCLTAWAEYLGIRPNTLAERVKKWGDIEKAFTTPRLR